MKMSLKLINVNKLLMKLINVAYSTEALGFSCVLPLLEYSKSTV